MKTLIFFLVHCCLVTAATPTLHAQTTKDTNLCFVKNSGQVVDVAGTKRPQILYTAEAGDVKLYFTKQGVSYVFSEKLDRSVKLQKHPEGRAEKEKKEKEKKEEKIKVHRVDMQLIGGNANVEVVGADKADYYCNYYLPHCQEGLTGVPVYQKLVYKNVYDSVDLVFYPHESGVKYDFIVRPGGNVSNIRFRYNGAKNVALASNGRLRVETTLGELEEHKPISYRKKKNRGGQDGVQSSFTMSNGVIRFNVGAYDVEDTLVLDPGVQWSTYVGGSGIDAGDDIVVDSQGNVILRGQTRSSNFPVSTSASQTTFSGVSDTFVIKMTPSGQRLWSTYFGGTNLDEGLSAGCLAVDKSNNIVIVGSTQSDSSSFPETVGAFQRARSGSGTDAYVAKFSTTGTLLWATYYGGTSIDEGVGITTDNNNNVIFVGETLSTNFPVSSGAFQTSRGASNSDGFIVKFDSNGQRLWGTYFGGSGAGWEVLFAASTDRDNNIIVSGTGWSGFPVTSGAFQTTIGGDRDGVIAKFTPSGSRVWSTYMGGSLDDYVYATTVDSKNNIIAVGMTGSSNFPITSTTSVQSTFGGGDYDGFIAKFSTTGSRVWSSYYGGSKTDGMYGVALDPVDNIYIAGNTESTNLSVTPDAVKAILSGTSDAFVLKVSTNYQRLWSSYFGGSGTENGSAMAVDLSSSILLAGYTNSTNLNVTVGAFQTQSAGSGDAFIAKFADASCLNSSIPAIRRMLPVAYCSTGNSVILDAGEHADYLWSNGIKTRYLTVTQDGFYFVTVWNEFGCYSTSTVLTVDIP